LAQLGERTGEVRLAKEIARLRKDAAGHEHAPPLGVVEQLGAIADVLGHDVREGKPLRRVVHRGLEQAAQRHGAEALEQHAPGPGGAGHRDRARPDQRDGLETPSPQLSDAGPRARARGAEETVWASMTFPPALSTSTRARLAGGWQAATMPRRASGAWRCAYPI